jgi:hypothetical protein
VSDDQPEEDEGGESACLAHLICPECCVVLDGAEHLKDCSWADPEKGLSTIGNLKS